MEKIIKKNLKDMYFLLILSLWNMIKLKG